jgi:hypothetical protein
MLVLTGLWPTCFSLYVDVSCTSTRILPGVIYGARVTRNQIYCNFPYPITMVITHYTNTRETPTPSSSPEDIDIEEAVSAGVPIESLALLPDGSVLESQRSLTERNPSAISSFLDRNAGLLLAASAQFFFSASNVCVKWLSSLDESDRIPMLEVRDLLGGNRCSSKLTT